MSSTLTVSSGAVGDHNVTITGVSGSATHTLTVVVSVISSTGTSNLILGLTQEVFYSIVAVAIVAVAGGIAVLVKRRPRSK
jgi:hypothetical protein